MKIRIIHTFIMLLVWISTSHDVYAQASDTVCAGQKGDKYKTGGSSGSVFHWTVEGGQIISDPLADTITINWGTTSGNFEISVFEEMTSGCLGEITRMNIELLPSPVIDLGGNINLCEGGQIELVAGTGHDTIQNKYHWQDGSSEPTFIANKGGLYWVKITNKKGCSFRDSVNLVANPLPKINLGNDTTLCAPNELVLDAANFGDIYKWSNGATSQTITVHENEGKIKVIVTDANGCIGSDSIQILKCQEHTDLIIPKAFTPGSTLANPNWMISGVERYPNISVKVFDRWGILIFESKGYSNPWDGTSQGRKMPMDAYYYIINLGDGSKEIVGSVTLIR